jgi:hypothetical protein
MRITSKNGVSKVLGTLSWSWMAASLLVLTSASSAFAQDTKKEDTKDGYGYSFSDDPLAAGGFGPADATIRVRPGPVRQTLIRPRTSFVPEMLKSVENL